jgi:hypothetical protein
MATADETSGTKALAEKESEWIGFDALDPSGKRIGTVKAAWEDGAGRLTYLGIATGWLGLGRIHVVPAREAEFSAEDREIRMPFEASVITMGPDFDADYEITAEGERLIRAYYRDRGPDGDADFNPDPGDPSLYTGLGAERGDASPGQAAVRGGPDGSAGETGRTGEGGGPFPRDWAERTDAPMAYGDALGAERDQAGPDRALAGPESLGAGGEDTDPGPHDLTSR